MELHNTEQKYGMVAKSLHWIVGLLVIAVWTVGIIMTDMPNESPLTHTMYNLHKSTGMVILMLVIIRLSWRLYDGSPKFTGMNPIIATAARTVHYLLYLCLFAMPLSGWAMSSAAGYNPTFYGLFTFPAIVAKDQYMSGIYFALHNTFAWIILILFVAHVAGALFHHFVLKDNTLRRMTTG